MRRSLFPMIAPFALAGCAHASQPAIEVRTVEVPTPVACVKASEIPAEPQRVADKLTGRADHDVSIVAESALELRRWGGKLRAMLVGCASAPE